MWNLWLLGHEHITEEHKYGFMQSRQLYSQFVLIWPKCRNKQKQTLYGSFMKIDDRGKFWERWSFLNTFGDQSASHAHKPTAHTHHSLTDHFSNSGRGKPGPGQEDIFNSRFDYKVKVVLPKQQKYQENSSYICSEVIRQNAGESGSGSGWSDKRYPSLRSSHWKSRKSAFDLFLLEQQWMLHGGGGSSLAVLLFNPGLNNRKPAKPGLANDKTDGFNSFTCRPLCISWHKTAQHMSLHRTILP